MQQQKSYNSSEAARLFGLNNTTVQREIQRGELIGTRSRDRSPFRIDHAELMRWAIAKGHMIHRDDGALIDPATGEIVDPEPTDAEKANIAAYESAQLGPVTVVNGEVTPLPATRGTAVNVSRVLLPSADAGLLEAARRLVALPESPALWQALRAVLAVETPVA